MFEKTLVHGSRSEEEVLSELRDAMPFFSIPKRQDRLTSVSRCQKDPPLFDFRFLRQFLRRFYFLGKN